MVEKKILLLVGIEKRYSMDLYATELAKFGNNLSNIENNFVFDVCKLHFNFNRSNSKLYKIYFYFYKYLIIPFKLSKLFEGYHIVHIVDQTYAFILLFRFLFPNIKFIVTVHDLIPFYFGFIENNSDEVNVTLPYRISISSLRFSDEIIFPSHFTKSIFDSKFKFEIRKNVVAHGVQSGERSDKIISNPFFRFNRYEDSITVSLVEGEFYKNSSKCFEIIFYLSHKFRSVKINVMGRGSINTHSLVEKYGFTDVVTYKYDMSKSEIDDFYYSTDLFIFFSKMEGLGQPFIESLSRCVPVLASDIPVFREITNHLYPLYPLNMKSSDIVKSFLDYSLTDSFKKNLIESHHYSKKFQWNSVIKDFIKVYRGVI